MSVTNFEGRPHMNLMDPLLTALQFNACISNKDLKGLSALMSEDHAFIDRDGTVHNPKARMIKNWRQFFRMYPRYRNIFSRVELQDDLVIMIGHAYWNKEKPRDRAIWTAKIRNDHVEEWRIYADNRRNRARFGIRS